MNAGPSQDAEERLRDARAAATQRRVTREDVDAGGGRGEFWNAGSKHNGNA